MPRQSPLSYLPLVFSTLFQFLLENMHGKAGPPLTWLWRIDYEFLNPTAHPCHHAGPCVVIQERAGSGFGNKNLLVKTATAVKPGEQMKISESGLASTKLFVLWWTGLPIPRTVAQLSDPLTPDNFWAADVQLFVSGGWHPRILVVNWRQRIFVLLNCTAFFLTDNLLLERGSKIGVRVKRLLFFPDENANRAENYLPNQGKKI
ncbi:hypothetical protein B0H19DRAFT_1235451 [Mycena capillaripes]|nr:hypothetical protein B0H19DRAFT_1235451 [Mycena capillaripes]